MQVRFSTLPYIIIEHMLEIIIRYNLSNLLIWTKKTKHIWELIEKHFRTICLLFIIHLQLQLKFMKV